MIWTLDWGPVARRDFLKLPMPTAQALDAAILRFAQTGRGPVVRPFPHDPRRLRLVVTGALAFMHADEQTGVLYVGRIYERGRF